MKKVYLLGAAAVFSLALVATSCSKDDETCVDCTDGTDTWELCWEEGNNVDKLSKTIDFAFDHPNAICDEE